jgi:hypothetical protein
LRRSRPPANFARELPVKVLLADWRHYLPYAGAALVAVVAAYFLFRKRVTDPLEVERQRRLYLNKIGRIVEGQVLEIVDKPTEASQEPPKRAAKPMAALNSSAAAPDTRLLYYTYSISGVTYETAQDISGMEERACLDHAVVGQAASVKYDPSNPSNSILIADDWSGLH